MHVNCADGRIVNANPPWGLNQKATTGATKVKATWKAKKGSAAKLTGLTVGKVPTQTIPDFALEHDPTIKQRYRGVAAVTCSGSGCFQARSTSTSLTKPVDLMTLPRLLGEEAEGRADAEGHPRRAGLQHADRLLDDQGPGDPGQDHAVRPARREPTATDLLTVRGRACSPARGR